MEHLKENVENLSDDKIFEEIMKIIQEKSLQKFAKMNNQAESKNEGQTRKDEAFTRKTNVVEKVKVEIGNDESELDDVNVDVQKRPIENIGENNIDVITEETENQDSENSRSNLENPVEIIIKDDAEPLGGVNDDCCTSRHDDNVEISVIIDPVAKSRKTCFKSQSIPLERCPFCLYRANHVIHLKTHISTVHSSLTCFRCPLCPASSSPKATPHFFSHSQLSALRGHIDRKHRNRRYECPKCRQKFTTLWNCEGHMATRHPEGKFSYSIENLRGKSQVSKKTSKQCPYCEYKGPTSSAIRKHVAGKHASCLVYKCWRCDFRAELVDDMRKHVEDQHFNAAGIEGVEFFENKVLFNVAK